MASGDRHRGRIGLVPRVAAAVRRWPSITAAVS